MKNYHEDIICLIPEHIIVKIFIEYFRECSDEDEILKIELILKEINNLECHTCLQAHIAWFLIGTYIRIGNIEKSKFYYSFLMNLPNNNEIDKVKIQACSLIENITEFTASKFLEQIEQTRKRIDEKNKESKTYESHINSVERITNTALTYVYNELRISSENTVSTEVYFDVMNDKISKLFRFKVSLDNEILECRFDKKNSEYFLSDIYRKGFVSYIKKLDYYSESFGCNTYKFVLVVEPRTKLSILDILTHYKKIILIVIILALIYLFTN